MTQAHDPLAITGYRALSDEELALINDIKAVGARVEEVVKRLRRYEPAPDPVFSPGAPTPDATHVDQRWVSLGATHLQQGFMALTRAVAKPRSFA